MESNQTLSEIREMQRIIEQKRLDPKIDKDERELLELSSIALREAERGATLNLQKNIVSQMRQSADIIKDLSAQIRKRVTSINKTSKILDTIESVIKLLTKVLTSIIKW